MKKIIAIALVVVSIGCILTGCVDDSYDAQDLQDSKNRYYSGGKYSREDERMVEGFNKWKADQNKYTD